MKKKSIKNLNSQLFKLIDSFPKARWELLDFHFKTHYSEYIEAIENVRGRKITIFSQSLDDFYFSIKPLLLLSDTIIFNFNDYHDSPYISIFPIPDKFISPALGVNPILDPQTRKYRFPKPAAIKLFSSKVINEKIPDSIFGYEWNRPESSWQLTKFTKTSEPFINEYKENCHIAVGLGYMYDDTIYEWLLKDGRSLLIDGNFVFTPFIRKTPNDENLDEGLHKSRLLNSSLITTHDDIKISKGELNILSELEIPYLENIPMELLIKAKNDYGESLSEFQREVNKKIEELIETNDPEIIKKDMKHLKRDLFEEEFNIVNKLCNKLLRKKVFSSLGAVLTTTSVTIAGVLGLGLPGIILAGTCGLTTSLKQLFETYELNKEMKSNPMYWVWKLSKKNL